jgi:hypothetical protein
MREFNPNRTLWHCPICYGVNAWNWQDAERAEQLLKKTVKIAHGSCFDNICGHCGADFVAEDSPIMAECYTHIERS